MEQARKRGWKVRVMPPIDSQVVRDWPDLECVHPERGFFFAELKSETGKLRPGQTELLLLLSMAGIENHVWRPSDFAMAITRLEIKGLYNRRNRR